MSACGREFHITCMLTESSFFEAVEVGHERDADQSIPTHFQKVTYPENQLSKEEVACVKLKRSLEHYLQHVGVHYPVEG
ncbi:hypothetical protein TNCV_2479081 [Trichonephila clavipes]|nr:hypothetical protein TNCV_2479081 [Trichonephila clavipes]